MTQTYGPYSAWRQASGFIFTSGQVGIKPGDKTAAPDITAQTKQTLDNLASVLEAANSSLDKVIKTTIFLANIDDFAQVNDIYAEYFDGGKPARSTVEVSSLPKIGDVELLIEIEAIATT